MSISDYDLDGIQPVTISRERYRELLELESQLAELRVAIKNLDDATRNNDHDLYAAWGVVNQLITESEATDE